MIVVAMMEGSRPLVRQFSKQIAGHCTEKGSSKPGMLKHSDGSLLKPILSPPRGPREVKFYEEVFNDQCTDPIVLELRQLMPEFRGIFHVDPDDRGFLRMEDVTENLKRPCILDVKIGGRTYDPDATKEKILREQHKYRGTKSLGFCIPGMRVHQISTDKSICHGKEFGKKLNENTVKDALLFYLNTDCDKSPVVIRSFLDKLERVKSWFERQTVYSFYASSLLLVYDTDKLKNDVDSLNGVQSDPKGLTDVRMIDFAHVFPSTLTDDNYLHGLNSLIVLFEQLLTQTQK